MKIKNILISSLFAFSAFSLSSIASANLLGQAGDIAVGQPFVITKSEIASYFKDGKSGKVKFICNLMGDKVKAGFYPGKNFTGNIPGMLKIGQNGPYTWTLHNLGDSTGNIKVKLIEGSSATVQCKQIN